MNSSFQFEESIRLCLLELLESCIPLSPGYILPKWPDLHNCFLHILAFPLTLLLILTLHTGTILTWNKQSVIFSPAFISRQQNVWRLNPRLERIFDLLHYYSGTRPTSDTSTVRIVYIATVLICIAEFRHIIDWLLCSLHQGDGENHARERGGGGGFGLFRQLPQHTDIPHGWRQPVRGAPLSAGVNFFFCSEFTVSIYLPWLLVRSRQLKDLNYDILFFKMHQYDTPIAY